MIISCIICYDLIKKSEEADSCDTVIIPCGHLFHSQCLYQWLERQQACPQCRKPTNANSIIKVFFLTDEFESELKDDCKLLSHKLDSAISEIQLKVTEIETLKDNVDLLNGVNTSLRNSVQELEQKQEEYLSELEIARCSIAIKDNEIETHQATIKKLNDDLEERLQDTADTAVNKSGCDCDVCKLENGETENDKIITRLTLDDANNDICT